MRKLFLTILVTILLVFLVNGTLFVMAIARGGSNANTSIELVLKTPESTLLEFDQFLRTDIGARCVKPKPQEVCLRWDVDEHVWIRVSERDELRRVILNSLPRHILFFGPPRFTRLHKRVEMQILDFWDTSVKGVEHKLR